MRRFRGFRMLVLVAIQIAVLVTPVLADVEVVDTTRVSVESTGIQSNGWSMNPAVSADGSIVVFGSQATNLVAGDTNSVGDVFMHDVATAATTRISVATGGAQSDAYSGWSTISGDGSTVAYLSDATNLVPGDTNASMDVFMYDVATATTTRVSVDSGGTQANDDSGVPSVTADGGIIVYESYASNLVAGDTNGVRDVFMYDVATGTTTRISVGGGGVEGDMASISPVISADGSKIAYASKATTIVPGGTNPGADVFLYDVATTTTTRISVDSSGVQADSSCHEPAISADGSVVVYGSYASNLVPGDTNLLPDVFMYDVATGTTTRVSVDSSGAESDWGGDNQRISADGSTVVYESYSTNLVSGDTNGFWDVFAHDVASGTTTRVSVDGAGGQGDGSSQRPEVSADGSIVVYQSEATNLVIKDNNGAGDVFRTQVNRSPNADDLALSLAEDVSVGTVIGTVALSDPDNDPLTVTIVAGNDAGHFAVDNNGSLTTAGALDFETTSSYTLTVDASDGSFSDTATVSVTVTDVYEVDPLYDPFSDDDGSVFEPSIEWLAYHGVTNGCNPPVNDEFCPNAYLTRGQMAAFLVRALSLPTTGDDYFSDDDSSIFEGSINRLAAAGITRGCNPPANTEFCPDDNVTRGQMAAFLVRARGYTDDGGGDIFGDDDGSVFESNIDKLATAGVTLGCNPPANTNFCPDDLVTRGQMAAFIHRALG